MPKANLLQCKDDSIVETICHYLTSRADQQTQSEILLKKNVNVSSHRELRALYGVIEHIGVSNSKRRILPTQTYYIKIIDINN